MKELRIWTIIVSVIFFAACESEKEEMKLGSGSDTTNFQTIINAEIGPELKSPEDVVRQYLELTKYMMLDKAYEFYTADSKRQISKDEFTKDEVGLLDYEILGSGFQADTAWVRYRVREVYLMMVVSEVRRRLIKEDGEWRILKGRETIWTSLPDKYRSTHTTEP